MTIQGKRVRTEEYSGLKPGEYGIDPRDGNWYCCTPNGHFGALGNHDIIEHEDGTITVSPSIQVTDGEKELWHGYLEHGIWRGA